ncbi:flagellar basal body P-ring formation chaperone FlgA [Marivita sp. S2033]|uniref:flagellar basal body P-ring formation chaperone FlgA n=1 Tax=Marivita sp. S2033 TaxID=3373187 RepID=UPI0039820D8C
MRLTLPLLLAIGATPAFADTVFALKTLRAKDVITADSVHVKDTDVAGALRSLDAAIGQEVKRAVYAGRPILAANITKPALVERNQVVQASFILNGLTIDTEVRAMERGSAGDIIRAMNMTSRATIHAEIQDDGRLKVLP